MPHDKLHRVTDNRLAEADHKDLQWDVPVEKTGKICDGSDLVLCTVECGLRANHVFTRFR